MPFKAILDYLAPQSCLNCAQEGQLLCEACLPLAIIAKASTCYHCNASTLGFGVCSTCRRHSPLRGVVVGSHYEGHVKELIGALKYNRSRSSAYLAARIIVLKLADLEFDIIVPVPTAAGHYAKRGYNQAALIASELSVICKRPVAGVLWRLGETGQVGHNRSERLRQLAGQISLRQAALVAGSRVLIVDDVLTTGATLAECAHVLKAAKAKSVWGAVVAKH